jgi:hypothetical protein
VVYINNRLLSLILVKPLCCGCYRLGTFTVDKRETCTAALTSPSSGGRSVGVVRSRTQATEFSFLVLERATLSSRCADRCRKGFAMFFVLIWTYGIQLWGTASTSNIEILERFLSKALCMILMHFVKCRIRLSKGISKYQQLKKKSAATALNTVLASAHIQVTQQ